MSAQEASLLEILGVDLDEEMLRLALTHRSYAYEHGGGATNERLEFLGDSVLGFSVTDALYHRSPDLAEGELAKQRSAVVSTRALASVARALGIGRFILLGQGEQRTNGQDKSSILADTMEALIGAVYIRQGINAAQSFVLRIVGDLLDNAAALGEAMDWKTRIQERAAQKKLGDVMYEVRGEGPDHAREYEAMLVIGGVRYAHGRGRSKKEAEQSAAECSWPLLHERARLETSEVPVEE